MRDVNMKDKEPWLELAEQAANEPDRDKLLVLVMEINRLLETGIARLGALRKPDSSPKT
jgi:hypothetical protein